MIRIVHFICLVALILPVSVSAEDSEREAHIQPFHVRVSSYAQEGDSPLFDGKLLYDGDFSTGWKENSDGDGAGQWVQLFFPDNVVVDAIFVRTGIGEGDNFKMFNRVRKASLIYADREQQTVTLADDSDLQQLKPLKKTTNSLSFVIEDVYQGNESHTSGISELYVEYHRPGPEEKAAMEAASRPKMADPATKVSRKNESVMKLAESDRLLTEEEAQKVFADFFYRFYSNFVHLNDNYPRMYSEKEYMRESVVFESFKRMIEKRGVLKYYQDAIVSTEDLKIEIRSLRKREADLTVTGFYEVVLDMKINTIPEDAKYYLIKEYGEWKVAEKVENPF